MDRPDQLKEKFESGEIDRKEAIRQLNEIADSIAMEIKELKSSNISKLKLNGLISQKPAFTALEMGTELSSLVAEVKNRIETNAEVASLDGMGEALEIFDTLLSISTYPIDYEGLIRLIDSTLLNIANSESIPAKTKIKFFDLLGGIIEDNTNNRLLSIIKDTGEVPTGEMLPINVYYVLNTTNAVDRIERLRLLKKRIKTESTRTFQQMRTDAGAQILSKYGDYIIDQEAEEYENERRYYDTAPAEYLESFGPYEISEEGTRELRELLRSDESTIDIETFRLAKVQLLRIYREYVNTLLSDTKITEVLIAEQTPDAKTTLRIGGSDDENQANLREKKSRRIALFDAMHMGMVNAHEVNFALDNRNYLPISPKLIDFWLDENIKTIGTRDILGRLSDKQKFMLERISSVKELRIPQKKSRLAEVLPEQETLPDGLPEEVIRRSLIKLGIGSDLETSKKQIDDSDKKITPDSKVKTYAVKVKPSTNILVDHRYRLFLISETYNRTVKSLMSSIAHEVAHIFQQMARDGSVLPGFNKLSTLGRSDVLAESGAIKVESSIDSVFNEPREINTYHFDIIRMIIEGKNYWEIFNYILKILTDRSQRNNEDKSLTDLIKSTQRVIDRAYANLGSMSNQTNEGRYSTNASFLAYTYQGMDDYSTLPFYISGIPSHRNDLNDFLPQPLVDNEPVTEEIIVGKIIEATYEVFQENGLLDSVES